MKEKQAGLDSTISIIEQLMTSRAGTVPENAAAYLDHMPVGYQRYRRRSYVNFKDKAEEDRYDHAFAKVVEALALLHREHIRCGRAPTTPSASRCTANSSCT